MKSLGIRGKFFDFAREVGVEGDIDGKLPLPIEGCKVSIVYKH